MSVCEVIVKFGLDFFIVIWVCFVYYFQILNLFLRLLDFEMWKDLDDLIEKL